MDSALSRYKIDGSDIDPQGKFELIKLELEKRMSLVPRLVFVTATVFVICFLAAVVVQLSEREASPAALLPGDLTPIFGQVNHVNRVRNIPPDENADLLRRSMADAQQSIKIVTLNGSSWIHPDVYTDFVAATRRVPVTLLMLDYTDPDTSDVFNNAMRAYGDSLWRPDQWENYFLGYAHLMKPGSKLKVGLYQEYPWSRFTIFDDKSVSFIVTPHVHAEKKLNIYYSEDRYIVDCFLAQFKKIQRSSEERGRIFTSIAEAEKFAKRHSSDSKD